MPQMMAIITDEAPAPVIEGIAILAQSGDSLMPVMNQVKAKIHAAEADRLGPGPTAANDLSAAQAVGHVDPVVDAEVGMTDAQLRILGGEPLIEHFALVRLAVAVGVLEEKDVRGSRHQHAALPRQQAVGEQQVIG